MINLLSEQTFPFLLIQGNCIIDVTIRGIFREEKSCAESSSPFSHHDCSSHKEQLPYKQRFAVPKLILHEYNNLLISLVCFYLGYVIHQNQIYF